MVIYLLFLILIIILLTFYVINSFKKKDYVHKIILDNIPQEFEQIYEKLYYMNIAQLEIMRKKVRIRTIFQQIFFWLTLISYLILKTEDELFNGITILIFLIIGILSFVLFLIITILNFKYKNIYKSSYKKEIISNFIKLLNQNLEFKPVASNLSQIMYNYKLAGFDNNIFNRFFADDYIEGFIENDVFIKMSDIKVQYETRGKNNSVRTLFEGIFAMTNSNKNIGTTVKIIKDKFKILDKKDKVVMDSEEFESYFDVYSQNKIIAMQILTSDVMELLLNFYKKYLLNFEIVFENNTIFLRFHTGPMFEPKIFGSSMDKETLFLYYETLDFITQVTKKINEIIKDIEF